MPPQMPVGVTQMPTRWSAMLLGAQTCVLGHPPGQTGPPIGRGVALAMAKRKVAVASVARCMMKMLLELKAVLGRRKRGLKQSKN